MRGVENTLPDQDCRVSFAPNRGAGPLGLLAALRWVAIYCLENSASTPIYIHAKVCVIDDTWACVGSDNANRRSWTHDSELSAAVIDATCAGSAGSLAQALRLSLMREHLGMGEDRVSTELPVRSGRRVRGVRLGRPKSSTVGTWPPGGPRSGRPAACVPPAVAVALDDGLGHATLSQALQSRSGRSRPMRRAGQY